MTPRLDVTRQRDDQRGDHHQQQHERHGVPRARRAPPEGLGSYGRSLHHASA
ncbi:hypothetical protein [Streptomyces sp. RKND-216]|uniref:hypothetical protein n=1 Tax=Streptomyces sp. RKND-216 TaxID=2562581 RepID=UPI001447A2D4|nr:hypothetical protein [Streptomyces sp. RKND-216]